MSQKSIKKIRQLLDSLSTDDLNHLLAFAEYLHSKTDTTLDNVIEEPQAIERPAKETVIGAIKRLSKTYPMLEKSKLLDETSMLMTQHLTLGRDIIEVVDDLEAVFAKHYQAYKNEKQAMDT